MVFYLMCEISSTQIWIKAFCTIYPLKRILSLFLLIDGNYNFRRWVVKLLFTVEWTAQGDKGSDWDAQQGKNVLCPGTEWPFHALADLREENLKGRMRDDMCTEPCIPSNVLLWDMHTQLQFHNSETGKWQICTIIIWLGLSQRWCHKLSCAARLYCSEAATLFKEVALGYLQFTGRY